MTKTVTSLAIPKQQQPEELSLSRMNMFFIKSKHAFRQFKNHDYFQTRRNKVERQEVKSNEFVSSPAPFGIDNAYKYICSELSKNLLPRQNVKKHRSRVCSVREVVSVKDRSQELLRCSKLKCSSLLPDLSVQPRRVTVRSGTIRDVFGVRECQLKSQQMVNFLYIDRGSGLSRFMVYEFRFNILGFIVNTFLKTRINYQQMTQGEFALVKGLIIDIFKSEKEYVEYKDMVNMRSLREVFSELESAQQSATYKREMIRYFFVANTLAYEYQLSKIKDQIKRIIGYQFNKDGVDDVFVMTLNSGEAVTNLCEMMGHSGKFLLGADRGICEEYRAFLRQKQMQNRLAERIKKWKSIVPQQTSASGSFKCMPQQRYQTLFESVQRRRDKWMHAKKKVHNSVKSSQFIDKQKLFRGEGIFQ